MSLLCAQKLARLQTIVAERAIWTESLAQVKRLHTWLLEVEHLLDESLVPKGEVVSNETVGSRLDSWRERMRIQLMDGSLSELERECLAEFLQVLSNLRSHLVGQLPFARGMCDAEQKRVEGAEPCPVQHLSR